MKSVPLRCNFRLGCKMGADANIGRFFHDFVVKHYRNVWCIESLLPGKYNKGVKNSALQVQKMIPDAEINILPDLYHEEFSLNHADDYVKAVEEILNGE